MLNEDWCLNCDEIILGEAQPPQVDEAARKVRLSKRLAERKPRYSWDTTCASSEACNGTVKLLFLNNRPTLEFVSQQRSDHDNAESMHGVKRLVPLDEPSHARVVGRNNAKYFVVWHSPPLIHSSRVITAEGEP